MKQFLNQFNDDSNKENKFDIIILMFAIANDNDNENTQDFNGSTIPLSIYLTTRTGDDKF